jgi:inner membrane protein
MDNLAHTLVGAALGRAVADRRVPGAAAIGIVAGNAPDWAEFLVTPAPWAPRAGVAYLVYHRGVTHSLLGAAVLTAALSSLLGLWLRWRARRRADPLPEWRWIAACVGAAVASHLYLDWQGSYGLRPLLPWNGRWYYADWVAIVDPFFWVVPLAALAWGARRHWAPALVFATLFGAVAVLVLGVGRGIVVWWVRLAVAVLTLVAALGWVRHWFGVAGRRRAAAAGLVVLAGYAGLSALGSLRARAAARAAALRRFGPEASWAILTEVGRPWQWRPVYASRDTVAGEGWAIPRHLDHPLVRQALATPDGKAIAQFARFLAAEVDSGGAGVRVRLWDARFATRGVARSGARPWAAVEVRLR